jgi:hypothetical protein
MKKTSGYFILLQILIGYVLADFAGGILHWIEDTYLEYCIDLPIIGDIARENEMHHYFPRMILAYGYIENMTYSLPISMFALIVLYFIDKSVFVKYPYFIVTFFILTSSTNIIHRFSHMRECENHFLVRCLHQFKILPSHEHHSIHHKISTEKYCPISTYTNYLLDAILFWRGLEYIVFLLTGIKPHRKLAYEDYKPIHNRMHENSKVECPDKPTKKDIEELEQKLKGFMKCPT